MTTFKFQYRTPEERQTILQEHSNKILIQESNTIEGNYLIFSTSPRLEDMIEDLKNTVDLILLKQEGII